MALFILAFGVVFELPVVLVLLAKVGVIDDKFLRKNRRWAIVILAVVAAVITPSQDAFSMLAMFIPLVSSTRSPSSSRVSSSPRGRPTPPRDSGRRRPQAPRPRERARGASRVPVP